MTCSWGFMWYKSSSAVAYPRTLLASSMRTGNVSAQHEVHRLVSAQHEVHRLVSAQHEVHRLVSAQHGVHQFGFGFQRSSTYEIGVRGFPTVLQAGKFHVCLARVVGPSQYTSICQYGIALRQVIDGRCQVSGVRCPHTQTW